MAYEFYMQVEGTKQGKFPGPGRSKGGSNDIPGLRWISEVKSPRDLATGQVSGKRQHSPMVVVTETGQVSPLFLQACCTNEMLKNVTLNFLKTDPKTGQEVIYYTVKLTNATIASVRQTSGFDLDDTAAGGAKHNSTYDTAELDEIQFTFQSIEWEYKGGPSNTMASDSWNIGKGGTP